MGCNTSKEAAAVPSETNKESGEQEADQEIELKEGDKKKENPKSDSAKTVILTSNGALPSSAVSKQDVELQQDDEGEIEQAATKIQAAFRGHQTRKSMKQPEKQEQEAGEPTREQLEDEFRADDQELCNAAVKIQASFRGHMQRKEMEGGKKKEDEPTKKNEAEEEELDIDLSDPDLNKAAVKIQASFRGHMVRKEHENEGNEETK